MSDCEFVIRPIKAQDLDLISRACWDNRETQTRLLEQQGILGMAAWQGSLCVGLLHCYRITFPKWDDTVFPEYGRVRPASWPLGWPPAGGQREGVALRWPGLGARLFPRWLCRAGCAPCG